MPLPTTYRVGAVTVSANGTAVSGAGTNWLAGGIREGDIFAARGLTATIESVDSATSLTLSAPWAGPALTASEYEIRYTPDASRVLAASRAALEAMEVTYSGNAAVITQAQLRKNNLTASRAPVPSDDASQGYAVGSRWLWQGVSWVAAGVEANAALWVRENDLTPEGAGAQGGGADDAAALSTLFSQAVSSGVRAIYLARDYNGSSAPPASVRRMGPGKIIVGTNEYGGRDDDILRHDPSANSGDYSIRITRNRPDITSDPEKRGYYFYQNYSSSRPGAGSSLFGFAANIKRTGGGRKVVPAQLNGYAMDDSGATVWGIVTEAWSGDPTTEPLASATLVGGEFAVLSQRHDNNRPLVGVDSVFKNRSDSATDVLHGTAGDNAFNRNSVAVQISSGFNRDRPASGARAGWHTGIKFTPFSLDESPDGKAIGIDMSAVQPSRMLTSLLLPREVPIAVFPVSGGAAGQFDGFRYSSRKIDFVRDIATTPVVRATLDLSLNAPSGTIMATGGTTTSATAGSGGALPATPALYLQFRWEGTNYRIPLYNA